MLVVDCVAIQASSRETVFAPRRISIKLFVFYDRADDGWCMLEVPASALAYWVRFFLFFLLSPKKRQGVSRLCHSARRPV